MNFKDLMSKLEGLTQETVGNIPTNDATQDTKVAGQPVAQQPTPTPGERPIPGQQPNLGPKTVVAPTTPQIQQVTPTPVAPQPTDAKADVMAMQKALMAIQSQQRQATQLQPTSSQSIQAQQAAAQQAVDQQPQSSGKPGEPRVQEELSELQQQLLSLRDSFLNDDVNEEWYKPSTWFGGGNKSAPAAPEATPKTVSKAPAQSPEERAANIESARKFINKNPEAIKTDPRFTKLDNATKIEILRGLNTTAKEYARIQSDLDNEKDPAKRKELETKLSSALDAHKKASENPPATDKKDSDQKDSKQKPAGSGKKASVSQAELDAFRKEVGNDNATLGQYLNAKQNLTAKKGGANDPEVIQSKLGTDKKAFDPNAEKKDVTAVPDAEKKDATANVEVEKKKEADAQADFEKRYAEKQQKDQAAAQQAQHEKTINGALSAYDAWKKGDISNLKHGQNAISPNGDLYWYEAGPTGARGTMRKITQVSAGNDRFLDTNLKTALQAQKNIPLNPGDPTSALPSEEELTKIAATPDKRSILQKLNPFGDPDPTKYQLPANKHVDLGTGSKTTTTKPAPVASTTTKTPEPELSRSEINQKVADIGTGKEKPATSEPVATPVQLNKVEPLDPLNLKSLQKEDATLKEMSEQLSALAEELTEWSMSDRLHPDVDYTYSDAAMDAGLTGLGMLASATGLGATVGAPLAAVRGGKLINNLYKGYKGAQALATNPVARSAVKQSMPTIAKDAAKSTAIWSGGIAAAKKGLDAVDKAIPDTDATDQSPTKESNANELNRISQLSKYKVDTK